MKRSFPCLDRPVPSRALGALGVMPILLASLLAFQGCVSAKPGTSALTAEVVSVPEGLDVAFRGKKLGKAPLELSITTLDDAVEFSMLQERPPLVERRVKVLGPNRVQVVLLSGDEPTALAKALGLTRVVVFDYGDRATFDVDKWDLKEDLLEILSRQAEVLKTRFSGVDVYICGHTDSTGREEHNQVLSLRRARSVSEFLTEKGLDQTRLRVQGMGHDYPLASNETPEGRNLNRRTEIILPD